MDSRRPTELLRGLRTAFALAAVAIAAAGCDLTPPEPKTLASPLTGDLSRPPAPRVEAFAAALVVACGDGLPTAQGEARLPRLPYVQDVAPTAATVMWTDARSRAAELEVRAAEGGGLVARLDVEADPEALAFHEQFEVRVEGLAPSTVYCYQLFLDGAPLTNPAGFRTAPESGPLRFIAFGDSGDGSPEQYAVMERMKTVDYDLGLVLGDVVYEWGTPDQLEAFFFAVYEDIVRHVPLYLVAGNHDYKTADAAALRSFVAVPRNGGPGADERWYSFDWGDAHFAGLDTEVMNETQLAWLDADLAATDRPWKILFLHRPLASFGGGGGIGSGSGGWREAVGDLARRHGVQLILAGHYHRYARYHPVDGVHQVISGAAGRDLHSANLTPEIGFAVAVLHFVWVEIDGDTLTVHAIDGAGREFDQLVIRLSDG